MTKPFHNDELVARIQAIVRRSKGHVLSVINTGDLTVDLIQKTVEVAGAHLHLTGKEYQMLELLSLRKGTTLTKQTFLNQLYGGMDEPDIKTIDMFRLDVPSSTRNIQALDRATRSSTRRWGRSSRRGSEAPPRNNSVVFGAKQTSQSYKQTSLLTRSRASPSTFTRQE